MNISNTLWRNFTLRPDGVPGATIGKWGVTAIFFLRITEHTGTVIKGKLINSDLGEPGANEVIELTNGSFQDIAGTFLMSFEINLAGLIVFLSGVVSGSPGTLVFTGRYRRIKESGLVRVAEPGDTGTAGGSQTGN